MKSVLLDIWRSFRSLPLWVQLWVGLILVPVNMASLFFWNSPSGPFIAVLAVGGMIPNLFLMFLERGFSKAMAFSHLIFWLPLLYILCFLFVMINLATIDAFGISFMKYAVVLFTVDVISICFDIIDCWAWFRGDRKIAS